MFHIYTKDFTRGFVQYYNYEAKRNLYAKAKKFYNYHAEKPSFRSRYTSFNPFEKDYRIKKFDSLKDRRDAQTNVIMQRDRCILFLRSDIGMTAIEISKLMGLSTRSINYIIERNSQKEYKKNRVEGRKEGVNKTYNIDLESKKKIAQFKRKHK